MNEDNIQPGGNGGLRSSRRVFSDRAACRINRHKQIAEAVKGQSAAGVGPQGGNGAFRSIRRDFNDGAVTKGTAFEREAVGINQREQVACAVEGQSAGVLQSGGKKRVSS